MALEDEHRARATAQVRHNVRSPRRDLPAPLGQIPGIQQAGDALGHGPLVAVGAGRVENAWDAYEIAQDLDKRSLIDPLDRSLNSICEGTLSQGRQSFGLRANDAADIVDRIPGCVIAAEMGVRRQVLPRDFEQLTRVEAESVGPPGQRRFRLILEEGTDTVVLWLEKQHLQALGHAFEQILTHLQVVQVEIPFEGREERPLLGADELQVGRLQVGYDEARRLVVLIVHSVEAEEEAPPDVLGRLTPDQVGDLAMQIRRVVNVGARQRANGHYRNT
jgi:hypothetical protein